MEKKREIRSVKFIRDLPSDKDEFSTHAHQSIVDVLYKLIKNEDGGITIGLKGNYGSGKSTIINLLEKQLSNDDDIEIKFFTYDTWAHAENMLRFKFLEQLYDKLLEDNSWDNKNRLKKQKKKIINGFTLSKISYFALFITSLTSLLPTCIDHFLEGIIILVPFEVGLQFNWRFFIGLSGIILWTITFVFALVKICTTRNLKIHFDSLFDESHEITSVEYEEIFLNALEIIFAHDQSNTPSKRKLIIVIDNLDRIPDNEYSSVLSTLQTFLQYAQRRKSKYKEILNQLWVIIPYYPAVMERENDEESFHVLDKRIQLNFGVPELLSTVRKEFIKKKVDEAFENHEEFERQNVTSILNYFFEKEYPQPRELINKINEACLIYQQQNTLDEQYPLKHIAYFVMQKPIHKKIETLIDDNTLERSVRNIDININTLRDNLPGLFFQTNKEEGQLILLKRKLEKSIEVGDIDQINSLYQINKEEVLKTLQILISDIQTDFPSLKRFYTFINPLSKSVILESESALHIGLVKYNIKDKCEELIKSLLDQENFYSDYGKHVSGIIQFLKEEERIREFFLKVVAPFRNEGVINADLEIAVSIYVEIVDAIIQLGKNENYYKIQINASGNLLSRFILRIKGIKGIWTIEDYLKFIDWSLIKKDKKRVDELQMQLSNELRTQKDSELKFNYSKSALKALQFLFDHKFIVVSERTINILSTNLYERLRTKSEYNDIQNLNHCLQSILHLTKNDKDLQKLNSLINNSHIDKCENEMLLIIEKNIENKDSISIACWIYLYFRIFSNVNKKVRTKNESPFSFNRFLEDYQECQQETIVELTKIFEEGNYDFNNWKMSINEEILQTPFFANLLNIYK